MSRSFRVIFLFLLTATSAFAEDTVKVTVGTQTYLCELSSELNCKAVNAVQQKEILLKKQSGKVQIEDKAKGLSAEVITNFVNNSVVYDMTLCSNQSCSISTTTSDATGNINQVMSGQYNITQNSFYVLGFFISTHANAVNLEEKILNTKFHLK